MSCFRGTGDPFKGARIRLPDLAAISHVFTIDHVAKLLGQDVEWLHELEIDMEPEDGRLWVHGVGEHGVPAFTDFGIECLKEIIANEKAAGRGPSPIRSPK
jgi:hypothetical protein